MLACSIEAGIQEAEERTPSGAVVSENCFQYEYLGNAKERCTYVNVDSTKPVLLVGDSRTVGFYLSTKCDRFAYVAKGCMGYSWLVDGTDCYNPTDLITYYIEANPNGIIIFNLGVNDLANKEKYAKWVENFMTQYPGTNLYYMAVNPVRGRDDLDIVGFNSYMQSNIPESVKWLDSFSYLEEVGFSAGDGVHYDNKTYIKLLELIDATVGEFDYE